jgi:enoyl-CoA hydratase/carnithine racemase
MTDAPGIDFELWPSAGPGHIAVATLNVPATLNSLDLTMVDALAVALAQWRNDPAVAMVYLRGAGDRAFCAGGDIQALYRSCKANQEARRRVDSYAEDFFEREYRLDFHLHTFPKPVLCFGHGVVMGGGLGLLAASRFRVVTPKSRVAMPEITIGLFPDAGGTTLLSAMPGSLGLFLGLTGTHFRGGDARALGLGTHLIADDAGPALEAALRELALPQGNDGEATTALEGALASLPEAEAPTPIFDEQVRIDGPLPAPHRRHLRSGVSRDGGHRRGAAPPGAGAQSRRALPARAGDWRQLRATPGFSRGRASALD